MGAKVNLEILLIIIFSTVFLYLAIGEPWDHRVVHPFPYAYGASDAFFHQATNEYIKNHGTVTITPPNTVGGYEGVIDAHPPIVFQLTAGLTILSGIEVHDTIMLNATLFFLFSILVLYMIWRRSGISIAMLALPICILMLSGKLPALITWGYWLLLAGILFMVATLWAIIRFDLKYSYIPIAFFISATALAHQPELVYAAAFFGIFLLIKILKEKKITKELIKKAVASTALGIILSFYSLFIFSKTFMKAEGYRNVWDFANANGGYPIFNLIHLKYVGFIVIAGFILFIISKKKKTKTAASVSIFCFLLGYLIYLGLGKRAYAHRLFWIMYLSFFVGFAIYYVLRLFIKKSSIAYPFIISIIILIVSASTIQGNTRTGPGVMNQYEWNALKWISQNTPKDAHVFYFYSGMVASNAPLYNSERVALNLHPPSYFEGLRAGQIKKAYRFSIADGYPMYLHKTGPFSYCYFNEELKPKNKTVECIKEQKPLIPAQIEEEDLNICEIEYYYFPKITEPAIAQYNMAIRNLLMKNDWFEEIYSNQAVSIIKNNRPGVDCFEE